jgi:RNA polymerase sigma factor (sigma-70 family)
MANEGERMDRQTWLANEFERHRPYLRSVAYRMLGSVSEAEDAIQECWLRLDRRGPDDTDNLRPWLTTVVGRICLDFLRKRRSRREDYAGTWLPEPIEVIAADDNPEKEADLADSVGLALLVVLENLAPAERLAFVLHDVFALPFDEIAPVVDRTPEATRQLASRARRRIQAAKPEPDADLVVQRRVVDAFLAAARSRDFEGLLAILDPDVVLRFDGGGRGPLARPAVVGAQQVAAEIDIGRRFAGIARPAIVNGAAGVIVGPPGRVVAVASMVVVDGRIREIDIVGDPAKLRLLNRV